MGVMTKIQWCHHTWNPWRGCAKISAGCSNCYAERDSRRNPRVLGTWGVGGRRAIAADGYWKQPYRWDDAAAQAGERRRVFCLSLGDWLELREDLIEPRARMLATIRETAHLDWLLLTKRPGNFARALAEVLGHPTMAGPGMGRPRKMLEDWLAGKPPENVWSGVSIEDQRRAEERYEPAISIPATLRFCSCEPLLGPIWFPSWRGIDWVIIGGESGPDAEVRPCDVGWIEGIIEQCRAHDVAPFVKQLGSWIEADGGLKAPEFPAPAGIAAGTLYPDNARILLRDRKGGDPEEWPARLNVREVPR